MKLIIEVIAVVLMTWKVEANWVKEMESKITVTQDIIFFFIIYIFFSVNVCKVRV